MNEVAIFLILLSGVAFARKPAANQALFFDTRFFDTRVAPILSKRCLGCHNNELNDGSISFEDRDSLLKGGSRGPAIVPGDPENSFLVHAIRRDEDLKMPPGAGLSKREIDTLTQWIKRGAAWGSKLRPEPKLRQKDP